MKYVTIEAKRSHSELNYKNKHEFHNTISEYFRKSENKKLDDYYISFTELNDKIGINPYNRWETPTGVYAYPISYVYSHQGQIPYAEERETAWILKLNTNNILTNTSSDYERVLSKIKILYNKNKTVINKNSYSQIFKYYGFYQINSFDSILKELEKLAKRYGTRANDFFRIWNLTRYFSMLYKNNTYNKYQAYWTKLLKSFEYDTVIDNGQEVIYGSEPYQAVFLTPNSYKVEKVIHRKKRTKFKEIPDEHLIPKNLIVEHDLDLSNSTLTKLPKGLTVKGSLKLNNLIKELPENLTVNGYLSLYDTNIKELPENLTVQDLTLNKIITKLPKNLKVHYISCTDSIKEVSENIKVDILFLSRSNVKELPKKVKAKSINLLESKNFEKLPNDLECDDLDIRYTKVSFIPLTMKVKKIYISPKMNISNLKEAKKVYDISIFG